jgi:predicted phosphodiesterase
MNFMMNNDSTRVLVSKGLHLWELYTLRSQRLLRLIAELAACVRWHAGITLFTIILLGTLSGQSILVTPYLQPGNGSTLSPTDVKVIAWMTDDTPGSFTVEVSLAGAEATQIIHPQRTRLQISEQQNYYLYAAKLSDLPLNNNIQYRVKLNDSTIAGSSFLTRKTPEQTIRFIVVGDLADGTPEQRFIAHQMAVAKPEFAVLCGDIVYPRGRLSEYMAKFWPVYNHPGPIDSAAGESLMQSVPFYVALGNHDTEEADLAKMPDAFAAFYFFHPPLNGPGLGPWTTPIIGASDQVKRFKAAAVTAGYPNLCFYSFDNGPAHFLVLDSDAYLPLNNTVLRDWVRKDLASSDARWKFVIFHHPVVSAAANHGSDQRMRLWAPLFEEGGVDIVFTGHVHNYQRSKPLQFVPHEPIPAKTTGKIRGTFAIDEKYDGKDQTDPRGVIYIVTGGGGAKLSAMQKKGEQPGSLVPDPDAPGGFMAKYVDDRHSFSLLELDATKLVLRQIDQNGLEVDCVSLTKPVK